MNKRERRKNKRQLGRTQQEKDMKLGIQTAFSDPNVGVVSGCVGHILLNVKTYALLLFVIAFLAEMSMVITQGVGDATGIGAILGIALLYPIAVIGIFIVVCFFVILFLAYEALAKQIASMFLYEKAYYGGTVIDCVFAHIFSSYDAREVSKLNEKGWKLKK